MNTKTTIIFSSILIGQLLSSCSLLFQKSYIATSPNVNCFENENEKNFKLSFFPNHYDIQSNFALSNKFGLSAGIDGALFRQVGSEVAGIYYKKLNDNNYFEIQSGYGYFINHSSISSINWDLVPIFEYADYFSQTNKTSYHKIFIQPTYFFNLTKNKIGFALKISANYFEKYQYYYCLANRYDDYNYHQNYSNSYFRYKWNLACEPALKIQFSNVSFLQLSGVFISNIKNSPIYRQHILDYTLADEYEIGKLNNPQHLYFIFTIGYEIKYGKKKE